MKPKPSRLRCARRLFSRLDHTLRREIDRLFDDFRPIDSRLPFAGLPPSSFIWPHPEGWQVAPAIDMVKDDAFENIAELPVSIEKNVEIKLSNGVLTIKGEKKDEKEEREKEYYLSERRYGSFQRTFRVPDAPVEVEKIDASFKKGVLTVTLPKSPRQSRTRSRSTSKLAEPASRAGDVGVCGA